MALWAFQVLLLKTFELHKPYYIMFIIVNIMERLIFCEKILSAFTYFSDK